jgi:hypothetical protein
MDRRMAGRPSARVQVQRDAMHAATTNFLPFALREKKTQTTTTTTTTPEMRKALAVHIFLINRASPCSLKSSLSTTTTIYRPAGLSRLVVVSHQKHIWYEVGVQRTHQADRWPWTIDRHAHIPLAPWKTTVHLTTTDDTFSPSIICFRA